MLGKGPYDVVPHGIGTLSDYKKRIRFQPSKLCLWCTHQPNEQKALSWTFWRFNEIQKTLQKYSSSPSLLLNNLKYLACNS